MEFGKGIYYKRDEKVLQRIKKALEYLTTEKGLVDKSVGNYVLDEGIEIRMQNYLTRDSANMHFETHYDFLDIHYMLQGEEIIRFGNKEGLEPVGNYNEQEDIIFYQSPEIISSVRLTEGHYVIFDPEDAHMAHGMVNNQPKEVKKIVVKIAIN